ncbi:ABC transporter permease [Deinococcus ficus]|uniref:ABC transporter permease n=1 Tax=Deinococcus ficus TaxID=317577 RepID=UPI0003B3BFE4|nr:ABC transporter permease [Deinococcus ficus]
MLTFIFKRLLQLPAVMLALTLSIVGLLQFLTPEERAQAYVTSEAQARNLDLIIREHGLDQPFWVQYGHWLGSAVRGDLGYSKASNQPVMDTIAQRLPATVELALVAAIPIIAVGVWLGMLAALHRNDLLDRTLRVVAILGFSLPTFVMGILLLVVFYGALGWFPGNGNLSIINQITLTDPGFHRYTGMVTVDSLLNGRWSLFLDALHHLVLPALTLIVTSGAVILKVMRAQVLDTMRADHVRTARAKGLTEARVNSRHVRRNALMPIVTFSGFVFTGLLGGVLFTETIFGYPGIGEWGGQAALRFDVPGVIGFALLNALIVVTVSTVTDLLYGVVDPRVRFGP